MTVMQKIQRPLPSSSDGNSVMTQKRGVLNLQVPRQRAVWKRCVLEAFQNGSIWRAMSANSSQFLVRASHQEKLHC